MGNLKRKKKAVYFYFGNDCKIQTIWKHPCPSADITTFTQKYPKRKYYISMWFEAIQFDCMPFKMFARIPYGIL